MESWSVRAEHNYNSITRAMRLHMKCEEERKTKEGDKFQSSKLKIRLSIPNQELLDTALELDVVHIDLKTLSLYVVQKKMSHDTLISILLGDIMLIGYNDRELQKKLITAM